MFAKRFFIQENFFLIGLGIFCTAFVLQSIGIPNLSARFPRLVALFALALIIWMLAGRAIKAFRDEGTSEALAPGAKSEVKENAVESTKSGKTIYWGLMWLLSLLYPGLMVIVGFPFATFIYLFGIGRMMAYNWKKGLIFSVIYVAAIVTIFQYLLNVPLPIGRLWEMVLGL